MSPTEINTLTESYFGLLRNLSPEIKLNLIERLSKTMRGELGNKSNTLDEAFGAWKSKNSADEIIKELRESRSFNRIIEDFG